LVKEAGIRCSNALEGECAWFGFSVAHDKVTDVAVQHQRLEKVPDHHRAEK
jgi:hypothetical protein